MPHRTSGDRSLRAAPARHDRPKKRRARPKTAGGTTLSRHLSATQAGIPGGSAAVMLAVGQKPGPKIITTVAGRIHGLLRVLAFSLAGGQFEVFRRDVSFVRGQRECQDDVVSLRAAHKANLPPLMASTSHLAANGAGPQVLQRWRGFVSLGYGRNVLSRSPANRYKLPSVPKRLQQKLVLDAHYFDLQHSNGSVGKPTSHLVSVEAPVGYPFALLVSALVFRGDHHLCPCRIHREAGRQIGSNKQELVLCRIDDQCEGPHIGRHCPCSRGYSAGQQRGQLGGGACRRSLGPRAARPATLPRDRRCGDLIPAQFHRLGLIAIHRYACY